MLQHQLVFELRLSHSARLYSLKCIVLIVFATLFNSLALHTCDTSRADLYLVGNARHLEVLLEKEQHRRKVSSPSYDLV